MNVSVGSARDRYRLVKVSRCVPVACVSQIEGGDASAQDVLNRYVEALAGTLKVIADFGDEQLKVA